jgi:polyisoprenoid-binding protein YceI
MLKEETMPKWIIDSDHTVAAFSVRYMMLMNVRGQFNRISGSIEFDPSRASDMSVDVEIDVASIWTGVAKRDEHLHTADFFDVKKHPKILFRSKSFRKGDGRQCTISGELTLHGVTRPVTLTGEYTGPVVLPDAMGGETCAGFSGSLNINREDFGFTWGNTVPIDGGTLLSKDVSITIDISADLAAD